MLASPAWFPLMVFTRLRASFPQDTSLYRKDQFVPERPRAVNKQILHWCGEERSAEGYTTNNQVPWLREEEWIVVTGRENLTAPDAIQKGAYGAI
jgi:hypothetical protein